MSNIKREEEKWNKQKSLGKTKFILINGVLFMILISIVYSVLTIFFNPKPVNYTAVGIVFRFITYAIIFGIGGIVYGYMQWNAKMKKYNNK